LHVLALNLRNLMKSHDNILVDCSELMIEHVAWLLKCNKKGQGKIILYCSMIYSEFMPSR
jgi:hypothetical protein